MRKKLRITVMLSFSLIALAFGSGSALATWSITDLGALGDSMTIVTKMNNQGQVIGQSISNTTGVARAFLWDNGTLQDLGTLGDPADLTLGSNPYDINDTGQVIGTSDGGGIVAPFIYDSINKMQPITGFDPMVISHDGHYMFSGFKGGGLRMWKDGVVTTIGSLPNGSDGTGSANATALNRAVPIQVVGNSGWADSGLQRHAFLFQDDGSGRMYDLGVLGTGTTSVAYGINNSGQVIGNSYYDSGTNFHVCLWTWDNQAKTATMEDLGVPLGGASAEASSINNAGQIVGISQIENSTDYHPFLITDGKIIDLNNVVPNSGWMMLLAAMTINDNGLIAGAGISNEGAVRSFIMTNNLKTTSFTMPPASTSLTVPVTTFIANDSVGVTGYMITESATAPDPQGPGWSDSAPTEFTFSGYGVNKAYAWAKDADGNLSFGVSATISVAKATATLTLGSLTATYDGTPKSATATCDQAGLNITFTYDGSPTAPTNAGTYAVVATVNDATYQGSASGSLTIAKAATSVTWTTPAEIDSDWPLSATQLNATGSVPGSMTYTPALGALLQPGQQTLSVVFTPTDAANYTGATSTVTLKVLPIGNIRGETSVTIADALMALRCAVHLYEPDALEKARGDVAPLVGGRPDPNGTIDISDALIILKRVVNLISW